MTDLTPNHPAVEAASKAWGETRPTGAATWDEMSERLQGIVRARMVAAFSAAFPHLTADDLPARLVRDIQVRAIRAAARAATYEDHVLTWDDDWDWTAIAAWLDGLADNIEGEADHG